VADKSSVKSNGGAIDGTNGHENCFRAHSSYCHPDAVMLATDSDPDRECCQWRRKPAQCAQWLRCSSRAV
jgi:hypothetical protein